MGWNKQLSSSNSKTQNNENNNVNRLLYKKQNRRPTRKNSSKKSNYLKIFSCNSSGLKNKLFSLSKVINDLNLSVFCLQETHLSKEGNIKFQNDKSFQIFEKLRETKSGGGLAIGARHELNPIWLGDGGSEVKALSIQIAVQDLKILLVNAYRPQEYDDLEKKTKFWNFLDNELFLSQNDGTGFICTMDGNSWLGPDLLKNDPHIQNKNGQLLHKLLLRNPNLTLLNNTGQHQKCFLGFLN